MNRLLLPLLPLLLVHPVVAQQDRWGISIGSGIQNALLPFRERPSPTLRAPITITLGRVFMIHKPDIAIWTYIRTETTGAAKTSGFGYRVSPSYRFGERNATGLFVDMFFGLSSYTYVSFPNRNERASGTFFSLGLSHAFARNHALDASVGMFRTIGPLGEGVGFQPSLAYSVFLQRNVRPLRSPKPKRFKNPSQCPESFD